MADGQRNDGMRQVRQEDLELDPREDDDSANTSPDDMAIDPATLFEQAMEQTRMAITITDVHAPDAPLIYVNRAFQELTGYAREEVLGRNCRFLQGEGTDPVAIAEVRDAIAAEEVRVVEMLNYRKDGSTFWNALHVGPVYDKAGRLTHYYGSQWDITDVVEKRAQIALQAGVADELQHRTGNLFAVMTSIVRLSARAGGDVDEVVGRIEARIRSLAAAHAASIASGSRPGAVTDLHELISTVLAPYRTDRGTRVVLSGEMVAVPPAAVTPLGLMLHELATNAVKYGAFSTAEGIVHVGWQREGDDLVLDWREQGGPDAGAPGDGGSGMRIMQALLRTIGASITHDWQPTGVTARLVMPVDTGP